MMNIERELRAALQRKSPSEGFAQRVVQQIQEEDRRPRPSGKSSWRAVAAAALLTVILGGWTAREIAGQRARDKVLLALRITSEKLQEAQSHVVK
jgi:hypothetical protein